MRVLPYVKADQFSPQQLVAAALYGRVLTSFQAAVLLAERGLLADTRTVVRGAAETAIILAAVVNDEAVCDLLIDRHFWHHQKLRQAWLNDPQAVAQMAGQEMDAVKAVLKDAQAEHLKAKHLKNDPVAIATLAQKQASRRSTTGCIDRRPAMQRTHLSTRSTGISAWTIRLTSSASNSVRMCPTCPPRFQMRYRCLVTPCTL
ncbi:DUF5677 domain-containing protein [Paracidovorax oryzae]|uniref:DUF5677 domain-containing protein n=1 Tax=Paracidovorax oryzae TaxID=862720 RepID=UPI00384F2C87